MKTMHAKKACLYGTRPLDIEIGAASAGLRTLMQKWRWLKVEPEKYRIVQQKALINILCMYCKIA